MKTIVHETEIRLEEGDLTAMTTDAIVNAANGHLQHGGGVAGIIVKKGGSVIQAESNRWVETKGPLGVGSAAITGAGRLPARYVIHTVGPRMGEGDEDRKLREATRSSLRLADENDIRTIALPAVSTGIFGYPIERCSRVMLEAARDYVESGTRLEQVVFCLFGREAYDTFAAAFSMIFPDAG